MSAADVFVATMSRTGRRRRLPGRGLFVRAAVLVAVALFFAIPLIWLALAPSKLDNEIITEPPMSFGTFENYARAVSNLFSANASRVLIWGRNSLVYTGTSLALATAIAMPAGYALATMRFPGRRLILSLTIVALIVPTSAVVLPLFLEMNALRLVNTPWSVILPSAFFPFGTFLAFVFYSTVLPKDLLDAGRVDGCSEWQLFRHVGLPLSGTLLGLLLFLGFTANWNSYFLPFVMLNSTDSYNLAVGLQALVTGTPIVDPTLPGTTLLRRPEGALMGLIMVVPIAIVFVLSQRFVVRGALTGAIKE